MDEEKHLNDNHDYSSYVIYLRRRNSVADLRREAISNIAALLAGFAVVCQTNIHIPDDLPISILILFGLVTASTASCMLVALLICIFLLIAIHKFDCEAACSYSPVHSLSPPGAELGGIVGASEGEGPHEFPNVASASSEDDEEEEAKAVDADDQHVISGSDSSCLHSHGGRSRIHHSHSGHVASSGPGSGSCDSSHSSDRLPGPEHDPGADDDDNDGPEGRRGVDDGVGVAGRGGVPSRQSEDSGARSAFQVYWFSLCEQDWRTAFQAFTAGVPLFLGMQAVAGWVVFWNNPAWLPAATLVTCISATALAVFALTTWRRWGTLLRQGYYRMKPPPMAGLG